MAKEKHSALKSPQRINNSPGKHIFGHLFSKYYIVEISMTLVHTSEMKSLIKRKNNET